MNDKTVSFQELLVRCDNLEKQVLRSLRTQRELSKSKNEKDMDLDRLISIQQYSNESLLAKNLKKFADITVEFVTTAFELENSLFFVYNNSRKYLNLLSQSGMDEDLTKKIGFSSDWITSHNIKDDPKVFIEEIDAKSQVLANLGLYRVIIAPIFNEEENLFGMLVGGVTTIKRHYFTEIDEKLLPIFTVLISPRNVLASTTA